MGGFKDWVEDYVAPIVPFGNVAVSALTIFSIFDSIKNRDELSDLQKQVLEAQLGITAKTDEELKEEFLQRYGWQKEQISLEAREQLKQRAAHHLGGGDPYPFS